MEFKILKQVYFLARICRATLAKNIKLKCQDYLHFKSPIHYI